MSRTNEPHAVGPPHPAGKAAAAAPVALRLALVGDVHVYRLAVAPWHLLSKRILGQMNLWLNRRSRLRTDLLPEVVRRIADLSPDAILCSGDLTTTALRGEFADARAALAPLLERFDTFIVPGNHDRYTFTADRTKRLERHFTDHTADRWPHHRALTDRVHLAAFDPTRATVAFAGSALDEDQLRAFDRHIRPHLGKGDCLIVLCHYPIGTPPGTKPEPRSHALRNAARLVDTLRLDNPVLYVHGHVHRPWCFRHAQATNLTIVNTGAPVLTGPGHPAGQGFWGLSVDPASDPPWQLLHHRMDESGAWRADHVEIPDQPGGATEVP